MKVVQYFDHGTLVEIDGKEIFLDGWYPED